MNHTKLIIFDLDDTLINTSDIYWRAKSNFLNKITDSQKTKDEIGELFEKIDIKNIKKLGFSPKRYSISMRETYDLLVNKGKILKVKNINKIISESLNYILSNAPKPIKGARKVLNWASKRYCTVLVTRGQKRIQMKKIMDLNLKKYFNHIEITDNKSIRLLKGIMNKFDSKPKNTWIIGDSIKSEINYAIKIGANCILYLYEHPSYKWQWEVGKMPVGNYFSTKNLNEIINIIKDHQNN